MQLTEHAIHRTRLADAGRAGSLVVGYFGSPMGDAVPRLLRGFLESRPAVSLVLDRADNVPPLVEAFLAHVSATSPEAG